jgi:hypothetical protein
MDANPVNIRQPGPQSRRLIEIRDQLNAGVNISHILNVKISNEPTNSAFALEIRRELKRQLWNVQRNEIVVHNNIHMPVMIRWEMNNPGNTCAYYYAIDLPYVDSVVASHTRLILWTICNSIRIAHPEFGNDWGIAYLVSKPLQYFLPIQQHNILGNVNPVGSIVNDDDDDDDEEEEE